MAEVEEQDPQEIQVSIVLEQSPSKSCDTQTVRMIGFVMINDAKMRLSQLRIQINDDFDDDQLEIIGNNFKFLKKTFPVSSKQEAAMQIDKICIHSNSAASHDSTTFNDFNPPNNYQQSFMLQPNSPKNHHLKAADNNPSTEPPSSKHSFIISDEVEQKTENKEKSNIDESQVFEALPHHYQYMCSLPIGSPINCTSFMSNKPDSADKKAVQNEDIFPKYTIFAPEVAHSPKQTTDSISYLIMVRSCHRVLSRSASDPNNHNNKNAIHSFLELDTQKSLSVFTSLIEPNATPKNQKKANIARSSTSLNGSRPLHKMLEESGHKQDSDADREVSMSPKPIGFTKGSLATASFICSYPQSPKSTRLETQLGEKLPRIQAKSSSRHANGSMNVHVSTEVDSILKNAMVKNTGYIVVDEDDATTIREEDMKIDENTEFEGSQSFSISMNETTSLHTDRFKTHKNNKTDASLSTPPQLFWAATQRHNPFTVHKGSNDLVDDRIKTKFTVIGHPILKNKAADDDDMFADTDTSADNNSDPNVHLEFSNATDLIKGLGGVHHSKNKPLWIDMVCDRSGFLNIAEHIRPAIHTLTIEDCLTIDCREKLEIFNEYLFICLKTWRHDNTASAITHTINVMIFKTMIITYHLGHRVTTRLLQDCRYILNKKFGNVCPSPSWVGHTIIDNVIDKMMPEVEARVREVETCEQFVFKLNNESQNELLHRMQNVRSWMVLYRSRLWPKSTITHNLLNNYVWRKDFLCDVPQPYWRDINDHAARMVDLLELGTQTLESIQNMFVAKVSLEMTQQSNNLASVGGKLAGVGAVFLPLTVITGIWGMNCRVPFQFNPNGEEFFDDNLYGFVVVMFVMALSSIITWQCVNRKSFVDHL